MTCLNMRETPTNSVPPSDESFPPLGSQDRSEKALSPRPPRAQPMRTQPTLRFPSGSPNPDRVSFDCSSCPVRSALIPSGPEHHPQPCEDNIGYHSMKHVFLLVPGLPA